jgi:uncharacterized protein
MAADAFAKESALRDVLVGYGRAMVAFSAGVDSTYLLDVAREALGERVTAVTADSPSLARSSLAEAEAFCRARGIAHAIVATDEFERDEYRANDGQRCYHCKAALMRAMGGLVRATGTSRGDTALLIGAIAEDLGDHRPGLRAALEAGARWPLADLGFTKDEVRERSRARGLATWDRPAEPCLSSRVPYGEPVTPEAVRMIEAAERVLRAAGFRACRARHHQVGRKPDGGARGWLCRIEVPDADLERLMAARARLLPELRRIGYASVAIDLAGLASGSLNALLAPAERAQGAPQPAEHRA